MKNKLIDFIRENILLISLLLAYFILCVVVLINLGMDYSLVSDDLNYIRSGINFLETGKIGIIRFEETAQIMPGMTVLIAFFAMIFGKGDLLILVLKIFWILMGVLSVYGLYKTINLFANKVISTISVCFLFAADFLWMNCLILTETPFMLSFIFLVYHSFKLERERNWKNYWFIVFWYMFGLMFRPNIGIYPLFLFMYLLIKKYDFKLLLKQGIIAGIILLSFLVPWTIRNYQLLGKFVPLTYGSGNPFLLGTYQGYNYPKDEELDYVAEVDRKLDAEMNEYLFGDKVNSNTALEQYYLLEYDKLKAEYRMSEWWEKDPKSMLISYLVIKPKQMIYNSFYWDTVLNIPKSFNAMFRLGDLALTFLSIVAILYFKKYRIELLFILSVYLFQIGLYSLNFSFSRYAQTLYFLRFIIIGIGLNIIFNAFYKKKKVC